MTRLVIFVCDTCRKEMEASRLPQGWVELERLEITRVLEVGLLPVQTPLTGYQFCCKEHLGQFLEEYCENDFTIPTLEDFVKEGR